MDELFPFPHHTSFPKRKGESPPGRRQCVCVQLTHSYRSPVAAGCEGPPPPSAGVPSAASAVHVAPSDPS